MAFNMKHKRFSLFIYFYGYNLYSFYLRLDLQYRWNLKSVNRSHTAPPVKCFHPVWIHFDIMLSSDMSADLIMPETKASKVTAFVNSTCAHVWVFFTLRTSIGGSFSCARELNRWPCVCHWDCWLYSHPGHNPETQSWSPF